MYLQMKKKGIKFIKKFKENIKQFVPKFILSIPVIVGLTSIFYFRLLSVYIDECNEREVIVNIGGVITAIVAASMILIQLEREKEGLEKQRRTAESQFMLEYNRSFIENKGMCYVEHCLEKFMDNHKSKKDKNKKNKKERFRIKQELLINYLVYLEGMSTCVQEEQLDFECIDNVFAYRFFIAVNNPKVQSAELIPDASYYRGCYQLYEDWTKYRQKAGAYKEDYKIPLMETSLDKCQNYELYLNNPIKVTLNDNGNNKPYWLTDEEWSKTSKYDKRAIAIRDTKVIGVMLYLEENNIIVNCIHVKPGCNDIRIRSALLKSVLYLNQKKKVKIDGEDNTSRKLLKELKYAKKEVEKYKK